MKIGSQSGRLWSACQATRVNNTVVQKQDEVAPVLGEVTGPPLKLPTLLYGHDEGVDVLCDDLLKRGSTGDLVFRNPLQQPI